MKEISIGARKVEKPLVLYGKGKLGKLAIEVFEKMGFHVSFHFDKDEKCIPTPSVAKSLVAVCVASEPYQPIHDALVADGWIDVVSVYDIFEAYPECPIRSGWFANDVDWAPVQQLLKRFDEDDPEVWSWMHYMGFWLWKRWHIESTFARTPLPALPSMLADIEARRKIVRLSEPMDSVDIHAEGLEMGNLVHNLDYFQKYRPKISVSLYHNRDGLWVIPKFCMDNLPDYRFQFRLHSYMGQGAVLYAIPKERG